MKSVSEILAEEGYYVRTTVGVSMRPMLRTRRDRVIIRPLDGRPLKKWDLPLYRVPDGRYILHRIIGEKDGNYIIRGDNTYRKETVPPEWIVGVMTEFYRGDKHVLATDKGYRFYAAFWQTIYPIRLPFHLAHVALARVKNKIIKPKKD